MRWLPILLLAACSSPHADPAAALLGGDATIFDDTDEAFNYPDRNLPTDQRGPFQIGDGVFNRNWVTAPATPQGNDGLGPTFNALSCSGCHANNGRGEPPSDGVSPTLGLLFRLSISGADPHGGPNPEPSYGDQLNDQAILGVPAEGAAQVSYSEQAGSYADGTPYTLRVPSYTFSWNFGAPPTDLRVSPRVAPQLIGLGLLQAVPDATLLGFAAANGGHPNHAFDVKSQQLVIGRFGWKANNTTVEQQTFAAFRNDIGITSTLFPTENCPAVQTACAAAPPSMTQPNLKGIEAQAMLVHSVALAVPARRDLDDAAAQRGETLFAKIGCASCHVPLMQTGTLEDFPSVSNQTIRPFTDLLLHDMGPDLADGRPDFEAGGSEWRTPPLWGLGLIPNVNDHQFLLHDGRARGFAEAILWHGGEAETAKESFRALPSTDREALIKFLQSL